LLQKYRVRQVVQLSRKANAACAIQLILEATTAASAAKNAMFFAQLRLYKKNLEAKSFARRVSNIQMISVMIRIE
jgi:hypothetical protein